MFGSFGGSLAGVKAPQLGAAAIMGCAVLHSPSSTTVSKQSTWLAMTICRDYAMSVCLMMHSCKSRAFSVSE